MIRDVLRMGDPRLLRVAQPVAEFATRQLKDLLQDMRDTMAHLDGAGLAAPQIGVDLRAHLKEHRRQQAAQNPAASP